MSVSPTELCRAQGFLGDVCRWQRERTGDTDFCDIADNDPTDGIRTHATRFSIDEAISMCQQKIDSFKNDTGCSMRETNIAVYSSLLKELQSLKKS